MSSTDELVRELHDRAMISELLLRFARALDERDWAGYAALYADDGVLQLPWGPPRPREGLEQDTEANLGRFHATQHISSAGGLNVWGTVVAVYVLATGVKGLQLAGAPVWIPRPLQRRRAADRGRTGEVPPDGREGRRGAPAHLPPSPIRSGGRYGIRG